MTPVSISPIPLFYLGFCTVMVVLSDARYKKAYEALTEYRLIDFLKHKWTHNPNVDIFNKMFFLWLVTLVLSAILFGWILESSILNYYLLYETKGKKAKELSPCLQV